MNILMKRPIVLAFAVLIAFALAAGVPSDARDRDGDRPTRNVLDGPRMDRAPLPASAYDNDDDDDDDDGDREDDDCIVLCHKPGTSAEQTKCLPHPAVRAHLGHGDRLGACEAERAPTILDRLVATDGAQALVAAVLVVDDAVGSRLADVLDDPEANLIVFAPGNRAFENLLGLDEGTLDGLRIETIAAALPGFLGGVGLTPEDVRAVLLKHAAFNETGPKTGTENALLARGEIEVADGSVFPISIGEGGVAINYESQIVKADVFASNGVIHFIDSVILDAMPPAAAVVQVFVTSGSWDGNLGGADGADDLCAAAASDAGLTGSWTAWLSDASVDARDRILDGEYRLLDGTVVASGLADLTDGTLRAAIDLDETGTSAAVDATVWTGTGPDGTATMDTCGDWLDATVEAAGTQGNAASADMSWTDNGESATCDTARHLYCFAAQELPPPDETDVCTRDLCAVDPDRAAECDAFLDDCLATSDTDECVATAALFCRDSM